MTTLVQTRQPLQVLSMSNQPKRRRSERLAGASTSSHSTTAGLLSYDEQDGDFHFTRGSKRMKTAQPEPISEDDPAPAPAPVPKKSSKAKTKQSKVREASVEVPPVPPAPPKRTSKRKSSQAIQSDEAPPPVPAAAPQRTTRRSTRSSMEKAGKEQRKAANGASRSRKEGTPKGPSPDQAGQATPPPMYVDQTETVADDASNSKKIALPFSDTPIINRNKEMRRKTGGRRSSLGMRGRRASSLIDNGHSAIPHREVDSSEFYKHIEAEGPSEPRRMKQLLTWCGERALSEKPPLGSLNSNAVLGARAIQDQLLKDFQSKSEFSDWFSREDVPRPPAIEKPNPRNMEHEARIAELEDRIKRLKVEKKAWLSLKQPPPELPPLFAVSEKSLQNQKLPDPSLLDSEEAQMLASLTAPTTSFSSLRLQTQSRMQALQGSLEFKVDHLADSVHKLEQRVNTANKEADRVLESSAARLREREEREKKAAGTKDMPVMEVLRSLGRILPEGGG
ncbi:Mis12-Mtw1 protein family-domain-containing protein [Pseudomassariella vexata]|uniref:Mis12-Mtw1 protein family-domain-containing protein n=1 Tax=Pseudomassariella vexata TaxID=1141098 RepID=A0A1Y2E3H9_9PEZI|nr:Mis12-Mtw1 protein family-domain-containing protein [Pseudomassariella vexata]ORY65425.1 Mis12-Mtw1 protein family-domain-containing protein [Pseudomassariella vexata]